MIRNTLIADDPKTRKRARLSWHHRMTRYDWVAATVVQSHLYIQMVPRDWFTKGLLADIEYYNPFGLGTR